MNKQEERLSINGEKKEPNMELNGASCHCTTVSVKMEIPLIKLPSLLALPMGTIIV